MLCPSPGPDGPPGPTRVSSDLQPPASARATMSHFMGRCYATWYSRGRAARMDLESGDRRRTRRARRVVRIAALGRALDLAVSARRRRLLLSGPGPFTPRDRRARVSVVAADVLVDGTVRGRHRSDHG